jgi:hypothetical protein
MSGTPDYRSQIHVLSALCPQLNLLNSHTNKIPEYATGSNIALAPKLYLKVED